MYLIPDLHMGPRLSASIFFFLHRPHCRSHSTQLIAFSLFSSSFSARSGASTRSMHSRSSNQIVSQVSLYLSSSLCVCVCVLRRSSTRWRSHSPRHVFSLSCSYYLTLPFPLQVRVKDFQGTGPSPRLIRMVANGGTVDVST
jgi:hypothetical protein